jgi:hypothetical protein
LQAKDLADAAAVHIDLAVGGQSRTASGHLPFGHSKDIDPLVSQLDGRPGASPFATDDQDIAARLFIDR